MRFVHKLWFVTLVERKGLLKTPRDSSMFGKKKKEPASRGQGAAAAKQVNLRLMCL